MEKDRINIERIIVIGGSAGSLEVLLEVLPQLKHDLTIPIVLVMHRKATAESTLVNLLSSRTSICLKEAEEKERIRNNCIYLAPADYHLLFEDDLSFSLDYSEKINYSRPSIDVSFESAAEVFKENLIAVLLSGANADGTNGLREVQQRGGLSIVQDPATAEVSFMPRSAVDAKVADKTIAVTELASFINQL